MKYTVSTALKSLEISEVQTTGEILLQSAFSEKERRYLATRNIRTTAGWLVLKRALIQLAAERYNCVLREKDITLECLESGRPIVKQISSNCVENTFFISISHTRTTAHGLAVVQEG